MTYPLYSAKIYIKQDFNAVRLKGEYKVKPSVLVTGAYGGMGKATVKALKERGFRIFALDRRVGEAEEDIIPIAADLTNEESVRSAFSAVCKMTDELYAIVHFAGIYMLDSLVEMDSEDFERIFRINLGGAYLVNKLFMPLLKDNSRILIALVIFIFSISMCIYYVAKAFMR